MGEGCPQGASSGPPGPGPALRRLHAGRIESGQLVTITAVDPAEVQVDDVVLVQWQGNYLLHLVKEIKDGQFLIGNNVGKINGWVPARAVKGKVVAVSD